MGKREDRPYMRGLSKPEKLIRVEPEPEPEPEDETLGMFAYCWKCRDYTEGCDHG